MKRFSAWAPMAVAMGLLACTCPAARAASVVLDISGTFGTFNYGNEPAPLNGGSFSGSITLASLPVAAGSLIVNSADVNFYNAMGNLVFNVGGNAGYTYDTITTNGSGFESLEITGNTTGGAPVVGVDGLSLVFNNWLYGETTGTVLPYGDGTPANYGSAISYTYPGSITYNNPVVTGQATTVHEPSSIALGLVGMIGAFVYARSHRRTANG